MFSFPPSPSTTRAAMAGQFFSFNSWLADSSTSTNQPAYNDALVDNIDDNNPLIANIDDPEENIED